MKSKIELIEITKEAVKDFLTIEALRQVYKQYFDPNFNTNTDLTEQKVQEKFNNDYRALTDIFMLEQIKLKQEIYENNQFPLHHQFPLHQEIEKDPFDDRKLADLLLASGKNYNILDHRKRHIIEVALSIEKSESISPLQVITNWASQQKLSLKDFSLCSTTKYELCLRKLRVILPLIKSTEDLLLAKQMRTTEVFLTLYRALCVCNSYKNEKISTIENLPKIFFSALTTFPSAIQEKALGYTLSSYEELVEIKTESDHIFRLITNGEIATHYALKYLDASSYTYKDTKSATSKKIINKLKSTVKNGIELLQSQKQFIIHQAISEQNVKKLNFLLSHKVNFNYKDENGNYPLDLAILNWKKAGNFSIVRLLLNQVLPNQKICLSYINKDFTTLHKSNKFSLSKDDKNLISKTKYQIDDPKQKNLLSNNSLLNRKKGLTQIVQGENNQPNSNDKSDKDSYQQQNNGTKKK